MFSESVTVLCLWPHGRSSRSVDRTFKILIQKVPQKITETKNFTSLFKIAPARIFFIIQMKIKKWSVSLSDIMVKPVFRLTKNFRLENFFRLKKILPWKVHPGSSHLSFGNTISSTPVVKPPVAVEVVLKTSSQWQLLFAIFGNCQGTGCAER